MKVTINAVFRGVGACYRAPNYYTLKVNGTPTGLHYRKYECALRAAKELIKGTGK